MIIIEKILITAMLVGIFMTFVNAVTGVKFLKIKYHLYSTILFGFSLLTFLLINIWK